MSLTDLPPDDPRRQGLRRMRWLATALLAAMTALFAATWLVPPTLPGIDYVRGARIEVETEWPLPVQIDGEYPIEIPEHAGKFLLEHPAKS